MVEAEPPVGQAGAPAFVPVADVYELEGALVIRLAVPGALEEDIDISFGPGGLAVRGETEAPAAAEGRALVREWRYGMLRARCSKALRSRTGGAKRHPPRGRTPEGLRVPRS